MAEQLELTDPVVIPEVVTTKYKVVTMILSMEMSQLNPADASMEVGLVSINLRDNNNVMLSHSYHGAQAIDMIKWMNTANFTVNSMQKRVLQKLSNDGVLVGTVTGTPDPAPPLLDESE